MKVLLKSEEYFDVKRNTFIEGNFYSDAAPFNQAIIISELYLPEIETIINLYVNQCKGIDLKITELGILTLQAFAKHEDPMIFWNDYVKYTGYTDILPTTNKIRREARQLLEQIVLDR